jgi:hypothetical protein
MPSIPPSLDLASYSDAPPPAALNLLFIHHSVGGQLLAEPGPLESTVEARHSLHRTHPLGGGLRSSLSRQGYVVHEASYGSAIGQKTDLFDWWPKFRDSMPQILKTRHQEERLAAGSNHVVLFKSCYPNSAFRPATEAAGNACGPLLTVANAKATLAAARDELAKWPGTLFIYMTAPPLRADARESVWKFAAKRLLGHPTRAQQQISAAALARDFNDWVTSPAGWLAGYPHRNIVVFDYFSLLTGNGVSNFLQFASDGGTDNHPDGAAQARAATELVPFINRAIRYAGVA